MDTADAFSGMTLLVLLGRLILSHFIVLLKLATPLQRLSTNFR